MKMEDLMEEEVEVAVTLTTPFMIRVGAEVLDTEAEAEEVLMIMGTQYHVVLVVPADLLPYLMVLI
jgi:hypothetical protein